MSKIRAHLVEKLFLVSKDFAGIVKYEKLTCSNYVFLSNSFESYVRGDKVSKGRLIKYWLFTIIFVLNTIRYLVLCFYNENWLLAILGEFTYKLYKIKIMAHLMVAAGTVTSLNLIMHAYFENERKFHCLDLLYHVTRKSRSYRLEPKNERNYSIFSYVLFKFFYLQQIETMTIIIAFGFTYSAVMAYFDTDVEHSIICLSVNLVFMIVWMRQTVVIGLSESFLLFLSILYLKFKFKEIIIDLKNGIKERKARNFGVIPLPWQSLFKAIEKHSKTSQLTEDLSNYVSYIIGFVYTFGTIVMVTLLTCAIDPTLNTVVRVFWVFFMITLCLMCYTINVMSASISKTNKSIAKHLYPIFVGNHFTNLALNMKIEEFIARLNGGYIGFYCFNLFKFDPKAFFEFFFILTSCYVLVHKMIK